MTIKVTPADVQAAGGVLTGNVAGTLGRMSSSATGIRVQATGFATASALSSFSQAWGSALKSLGDGVTGVGHGLGQAASTYQSNEGRLSQAYGPANTTGTIR